MRIKQAQRWLFRGRLRFRPSGALAAAFVALTATAVDAQQVFELGPQGFEQVQTPDPSTPEGRLHNIRAAIADGRGKEAIKLADTWIKQYPNHPLQAEATLLRGDAKASINEYFKALFDYELVARGYPESPVFHEALDRELKIAQVFGRGVKRKLWGMRVLPAYGEAEELLIRIQERAPGSSIAERAGIELADFYFRRSEMALAAEAYDLFLQNYPDSQWREHAMQRQVVANLATFKGPQFDATGLIEGKQRLDDYKQIYPAAAEQIGADALTTRIDESLAMRGYLQAHWYDQRGKPVSAKFMYQRVVDDHPGSAAAQMALQRLRELDPQLFSDSESEVTKSPQEASNAAAETASTDQAAPSATP